MTTDIADEVEISQSDTGEISGDTANQGADATATGDIDTAEADVDAFLGAGKEGVAEGTEADKGAAAKEVDPEVQAAADAAATAAAERAERETRDRITREDQQAKEAQKKRQDQQNFETAYRTRMANQSALKAELEAEGVSTERAEAIAKRVEGDFNSHHADGLKLAEPEAFNKANAAFSSQINEAIKADLGADAEKFFGTEAEPKAHAGMAAALKAYREVVTEGMVTKSESEASARLALLNYRRDLEKNGLISGARSGQSTNGGASGGPGTLAAYEAKLATEGNLSEPDWASYERLRAAAGLS